MAQSTVLLAAIILSKIDIISAVFPNVFNIERLFNHPRPDFTSIAIDNGFPPEKHEVVTEDGYILTLFHFPGRSRIPVFLLHGVLFASDAWILRGEDSLGITLANQGYDLWFGNSRGNRYSRRHIVLDPNKDAAFWKFSFHEVGIYDLPAFIDTILNATGAPTLTAIGHSQGTTAFYVLGSTKPEYNDKINVMISLAPVAFLQHSPPPLSILYEMTPLLMEMFTRLNLQEITGDTNPIANIYRLLCPTPVLGYIICLYGKIFPITGADPEEVEPSFYIKTVPQFPAGTSARSVLHYLQVGHRNAFAQFDNGLEENLAIYNSTIPPPYDLSKANIPFAIIAGRNDPLSPIPDVMTLRERLPNVVFFVVNPRAEFNHLDSVWGKHMRVYVFPYVFELLHRYNGFI